MSYLKFPLLQDKEKLEREVQVKSLHQIAEEIGSSYSALAYAVRRWKIKVPKRTTHRIPPNYSASIKEGLRRKYPDGRFGQNHPRWKGGGRHLWKKYGLRQTDKENLYNDQDGKCLICQQDFGEIFKADIDHCHNSGYVRGLLCHNCNIGLGGFRDNPEYLLSAIEYLKRLPTKFRSTGIDTPQD